jgi:hypothetical protein
MDTLPGLHEVASDSLTKDGWTLDRRLDRPTTGSWGNTYRNRGTQYRPRSTGRNLGELLLPLPDTV